MTTETTVPDFVIVPREMREKITTIHRNRFTDRENPIVMALEKGETLFIRKESTKLAGLYEQARRRSFKMTLRQGYDEDKNKGCYIWWESNVVEGAE